MPYGVNAFEIRDNQEGETGTANQAIRSEQCYIRMENRWMEFSIGAYSAAIVGMTARLPVIRPQSAAISELLMSGPQKKGRKMSLAAQRIRGRGRHVKNRARSRHRNPVNIAVGGDLRKGIDGRVGAGKRSLPRDQPRTRQGSNVFLRSKS